MCKKVRKEPPRTPPGCVKREEESLLDPSRVCKKEVKEPPGPSWYTLPPPWEVPSPRYMPPPASQVGVSLGVHAPQPHHADLVHVDGLLGTAVLNGPLQVVGRLPRGVLGGVFLEVLGQFGLDHGAITGYPALLTVLDGKGSSRSWPASFCPERLFPLFPVLPWF